jgi:hypothetical protein
MIPRGRGIERGLGDVEAGDYSADNGTAAGSENTEGFADQTRRKSFVAIYGA